MRTEAIKEQSDASRKRLARDERLQRFAPIFRERVAALTCCAPQAEDLIDSFPALLVALVSDFGSRSAREKAFDVVISGGTLKSAANALGLPLWLKKMPAEAFSHPLHTLPSETEFTAKIANFLPERRSKSSGWLEQVSAASECCDGVFALWVAKHCGSVAASRRKLLFCAMAAWAWHCKQPHTTGYRLIEKPWSSKMGLRRATEELIRWRRRADLACVIGDGIEDAWLSGGSQNGFEFVALLTLDDFIDESRAMNNCLDQYAERLSTGLVRIFSIRSDGRPIADIEVGPVSEETGTPSIVQMKGPSNRRAPLKVWQAAQAWLRSQPIENIKSQPGHVRSTDDKLPPFWQPYWESLPASRQAELNEFLIPRRRTGLRDHLPHPLLDARAAARL